MTSRMRYFKSVFENGQNGLKDDVKNYFCCVEELYTSHIVPLLQHVFGSFTLGDVDRLPQVSERYMCDK